MKLAKVCLFLIARIIYYLFDMIATRLPFSEGAVPYRLMTPDQSAVK